MNDADRKRVERELAVKVLGATVIDECVAREDMPLPRRLPQIAWFRQASTWVVYEGPTDAYRRFAPTTNLPNAWDLLGRLVEKSLERGHAVDVRVHRGGNEVELSLMDAHGHAAAMELAAALCVAMCGVLRIDTKGEKNEP